MNMLYQRGLAIVAAALTLAVFACSEQPCSARDAVADTMTTPAMRHALSSDFGAAERALRFAQDSVDKALGPELASRLQPLREAFVTYRKEECERLKAVFKDGTYGPVAELECMVHLTDSRREFIEQHYNFIEKIGDRGVGNRKANPAPGARKP